MATPIQGDRPDPPPTTWPTALASLAEAVAGIEDCGPLGAGDGTPRDAIRALEAAAAALNAHAGSLRRRHCS